MAPATHETLQNSSEPAAENAARKAAPRIWLLIGDKLGDNAQVEIIAEALGLPFERKLLSLQTPYVLGKPRFEPSLHHLDSARSASLVPPWPDLILTAGRRPAMAALWVHQQSGGRSKLVLIGRPKRWLERFDLVISTVQQRLPEQPNVLRLGLPLMRLDATAIAAAAADFAPQLAEMPRPLTALLVGGATEPFAFHAAQARQIVATAQTMAARQGGSLYVSTSRRTPREVSEALAAALPPGARLYRWQAEDETNPYLGLLGLADQFVVTGDSTSMLVEIARLGRPLAIAELPLRPSPWTRLQQALARQLHPPSFGDPNAGRLQSLGNALYRLGLVGYSRDLTAVHRLLIERGLAVRLGEPFPAAGRPADDELPQVVERLQTLLSPQARS
ncbi:mitochondrial fission ELM1 family protein [Algihabitans albus]|uniref:mitochondrial fission ELM1 family protein n=1 Tax=Algihabitans albus TaxID=2164067 RepID=UPI000E5D8A92|nr:ELM1/GtrOC1 family putative glycosyltransferase [Algihabitans albus]